MKYVIYTDGACSGNRRDSGCKGGYGYIILDESETEISRGGGKRENVTNNMMEMIAVIKALGELKEETDEFWGSSKKHDCELRTDSKYVIDNYDEYLPTWKKNGWRKANGGTVLNRELWKAIVELTPEFKSFAFKWVKGHSKDKYNIMVDEIATSHSK